MGAGKTTIGSKLASHLEKEFFDTDKEIENITGANIPLIFELEGEDGFRKRETQVLSQLATKDNILLATGGGIVLRKENREKLKEHGCVIYLHATLDHLLERTAKDRNRPLLQTENPRKTLSDIIQQREPLYREVADVIVETNDKQIYEILQELSKRLLAYQNSQKTH